MEFSETACLRLLISVAAEHVAELLRQRLVEESVLKKSPDSARRSFRAQCYRSSAFVIESIHFFLNHIRSLADASLKKLGVFKYGGSYLLEAERSGNIKQSIFKESVPAGF